MDICITYIKYLKDIFIKYKNKKIYCKIYNEIKLSSLIRNDWNIIYESINFTKRNVPFRNKLIIKPLYNNLNKIIYLMGITYNNLSHINIEPISYNYDSIINELKYLPFPIVLTITFSPFIIKYVNCEWMSLSGYISDEAIGKTFSIIQGRSKECIADSHNFKNEILSKL